MTADLADQRSQYNSPVTGEELGVSQTALYPRTFWEFPETNGHYVSF